MEPSKPQSVSDESSNLTQGSATSTSAAESASPAPSAPPLPSANDGEKATSPTDSTSVPVKVTSSASSTPVAADADKPAPAAATTDQPAAEAVAPAEDETPDKSEPTTAVIGGRTGRTSYTVTEDGWQKSDHHSRKRLPLLVLLAVLLLSTGGVLAFYVPNRPENVWKSGLNNTGKAIDSLVTKATDQKQLSSLKTSELTGDLTIKTKLISGTGTFAAKLDDKNSDSNLTVNLQSSDPADKTSAKLGADLLTQQNGTAEFPNAYVRLTGMNLVGIDALLPGVSKYDNKWIFLSSDFLKQHMQKSTAAAFDASKRPSAQDVADFAKTVSGVTKQYVFSADANKAVLNQKSFVGKEMLDGASAYHYTATVNKQHAADYCKALVVSVAQTNLFKKMVVADERAKQQTSMTKDCQAQTDRINQNETIDVWVDAKYKVISKIRQYNPDNHKSYTDIGQHYTGGNQLQLYLKSHDDSPSADLSVDLTLDTSNYTVNGTFNSTSGGSDNAESMTGHFNIKATSKAVQVTTPTGAVKAEDIFKALQLPVDKALPLPTQSL